MTVCMYVRAFVSLIRVCVHLCLLVCFYVCMLYRHPNAGQSKNTVGSVPKDSLFSSDIPLPPTWHPHWHTHKVKAMTSPGDVVTPIQGSEPIATVTESDPGPGTWSRPQYGCSPSLGCQWRMWLLWEVLQNLSFKIEGQTGALKEQMTCLRALALAVPSAKNNPQWFDCSLSTFRRFLQALPDYFFHHLTRACIPYGF
jgi:hypothetical protein